jgi:type IV pilus assembly protein PilV
MLMNAHRSVEFPPYLGQQSGFSLIEVMVTLLVLSIGLLGVAALQVASLQYSNTSLHRSIAVIQANDLVERLWTNICQISNNTQRASIVTDWNTAHANSLPGRSGALRVTAPPVYEIEVSWSEQRLGEGTRNFTYSTILPNLPDCAP